MSRPTRLVGLLAVAALLTGCVSVSAPPEASSLASTGTAAPPPTSAAMASPTTQAEPTSTATETPSPIAPTPASQTPAPIESATPTAMASPSPSASECELVTVDEMSGVMGQQATIDDGNTDTDCTYVLTDFSAVDISTAVGDLDSAKLLLGKSAKDLDVAGLPAVSGTFIGQAMVIVQNGESQLSVLGILLKGNHRAVIARLVQVATIAVGRWH